MICDFL